jgi:hypothetical protein
MQRTTAGYPPRGIAISGFGMEEDVQAQHGSRVRTPSDQANRRATA